MCLLPRLYLVSRSSYKKAGKLDIYGTNKESTRQEKPRTTKSELSSPLGLCNAYRRFIANFSKLAYPVNHIFNMVKRNTFKLDEEQVQSFRELIDPICHPPVLTLPQPNLP